MTNPTPTETVPPMSLGELQAKVHLMEARVASLIAFATAVVDSHPQKDILRTRWAMEVDPALAYFASLGPVHKYHGSFLPQWVETHKELRKG